jgi:hypothetical protein
MGTDTFGTAESILAAGAIFGTSADTGLSSASIVVRSTGEVVCFYNGPAVKTSGTFYARVYHRRRTAVNTWSAAVQVDASLAFNNARPNAVLGAADRVHFIWDVLTASTSNGFVTRTLSAANALNTAPATNAGLPSPGDAVSYDRGGVTKVVFSSNTGGQSVGRFDSADSPAAPTLINLAISAASVPHRIGSDPVTNDVTIVYRSTADQKLYAIKSSDDGATFGAPVLFFAGTVSALEANLSRNVSGGMYQRGQQVVVGYVVNDNGTYKYNESVIRTLNAWNAGDKTTSVTLSNNDKTAASSSPGQGVRSTTARPNTTAGKYYVEFVTGNVTLQNVGLRLGSEAIASAATQTANVNLDTGAINVGATNVGSVGSKVATGEILCLVPQKQRPLE